MMDAYIPEVYEAPVAVEIGDFTTVTLGVGPAGSDYKDRLHNWWW
jgi:hypothetical protein